MVDPSLNRITTRTGTVQVEPKIMQVLLALAERPNVVVTRDELMERVWAEVFVTDDVLNRAIRELRRVFDDNSSEPRVIETIRKRGYRLLATPESADPDQARVPAVDASARWTRPAIAWAVVALSALGLAAIRFGFASSTSPLSPSQRAHFIPLTTTPGNEVDPALSPSGRLAFVARGPDGQPHIFVKPFGATNAVQLTSGPAREAAPTWSPDDRHVAFARLATAAPLGCEIWIGDADGGDERRVAPCGSPDALRSSWSPDGRSLAVAVGDGTIAAPLHVELLDVATGGHRVLTTPPSGAIGDESPAFSPDGGRVAFVRSVAGSIGDIYVVSVRDADAPQRVTFDNADVLGLDWQTDGEHLVFASDRGGGINLWQIGSVGGEPELVAGGGAKLKHPSVARRTGAIAYEEWHYEINMAERSTADATGAPVSISPTSDQWNFFPQISPDQTRIASSRRVRARTSSGLVIATAATHSGSRIRRSTSRCRGGRQTVGGWSSPPGQPRAAKRTCSTSPRSPRALSHTKTAVWWRRAGPTTAERSISDRAATARGRCGRPTSAAERRRR